MIVYKIGTLKKKEKKVGYTSNAKNATIFQIWEIHLNSSNIEFVH